MSEVSKMSSQSIKLSEYRRAVFGYFFCQGICFASWASRIPTIKENLHLSEGKINTKYGSAKVITIVSILYALILVSISFATNVYMLAASLLLFGVAGNMASVAVNTQAVAVEKMYGKSIMTVFHGGWS